MSFNSLMQTCFFMVYAFIICDFTLSLYSFVSVFASVKLSALELDEV